MQILDYELDLIEYKVNHKQLGYNKCIGYIHKRGLPTRVIEYLLEKMCKKEPFELAYVDDWGCPEYNYSPKKFFIHFILADQTIQIIDVFYDIIRLKSAGYGAEQLEFLVKSEHNDLFTSFEYTIYYDEITIDYVLNKDSELIGAIIKPISKEKKSNYKNSYTSDYDIYSTDDFMRDNGYDPDNDTIEDMYNLD